MDNVDSLTRYPGRWWMDRVRREPYRDCGLSYRTGYGDLMCFGAHTGRGMGTARFTLIPDGVLRFMVLAPIPDGVWGRPWNHVVNVNGSRVEMTPYGSPWILVGW